MRFVNDMRKASWSFAAALMVMAIVCAGLLLPPLPPAKRHGQHIQAVNHLAAPFGATNTVAVVFHLEEKH